ncbi:DUF5133 domain-containing protein [Streptomyces sp. TG1A-60]|uniref:DUF5133 domain-containing protein n=1 Tax=Streptomyces sp. TG1A-60 TaxID=3129111 RepID=UPI0030D25A96
MLLPAKNEVARHLRRYRAWERVMLASPADRAAREHFEDSGYTLCVLMGERCAREAVAAAERYLRTNLPTYPQERTGHREQDQNGHLKQDQTGCLKDETGQARETRAARRGPPPGRRYKAGR